MNATVTCEKCGKPLGMFDGNVCNECENRAVLKQIRDEIEVMMQNVRPFDGMDAVVYTRGFNDGIGSVVDVIDKYTAERRYK